MKKHQFRVSKLKLPETISDWREAICIHCGHSPGLSPWQLNKMPKEMARCEESGVGVTLKERITGEYDCVPAVVPARFNIITGFETLHERVEVLKNQRVINENNP